MGIGTHATVRLVILNFCWETTMDFRLFFESVF